MGCPWASHKGRDSVHDEECVLHSDSSWGAALAVALLGGSPRAVSAQTVDRMRDHIYATFLLNTEKAWAVGSFGSIYHSADGGRQWERQDSGYIDPLYGVSFVSEQEGWISGKSGLILHTTDGGNTWQRQTTGTTHHLFNLAFVDAQRGIAVGDYGIVLQTTDGGQSWTDRSLGEDVFLYGVSMHPSGKVWGRRRNGRYPGQRRQRDDLDQERNRLREFAPGRGVC